MSSTDDWWNSLSATERESLMGQQMGIMGPTPYQDEAFGDTMTGMGMAGSPGVFDFAYNPAMSVQPSVDYFTTKGKVNYTDRAQEAARVNLLQDYGALSVDNILSGYAGAGAYAPGAFEPTYEFGAPINLPGRRKAEALSGAGGWQGFIADALFNRNLTPAEAEADLYRTISAPDDESLTDEQRAKKQALVDSMAPLMEEATTTAPMGGQRNRDTATKVTGGTPYNTAVIGQFAQDTWNDLLSDPDFSYQDPKTGLYYSKTPEEALVKTDQMKKFDAFGIPYPTASYEDPKYLDEFLKQESGGYGTKELQPLVSDFDAQQRALEQSVGRATGRTRAADEAISTLERTRKANSELATEPRRNGPADNPYNIDQPSLEAARKAAEIDYNLLLKDPEAMKALGVPDLATYEQKAYDAVGMQPYSDRPELPENAKRRSETTGAARAAAQSQYDTAYADWLTGQKDRLTEEAMRRGGMASLPKPTQATTDKAGNIVPFNFAAALTSNVNPLSSVGYGAGSPRQTIDEALINKQRQTRRDRRVEQSQRANAVYQNTYNDPRVLQAAALGRAMAYARAGQTPFLDAMNTRNTNARMMLSGG